MTDILIRYGLFLAQSFTIVIAVLFVVGGIFSIVTKGMSAKKDQVEVKNINEKLDDFAQSINSEMLPKKAYKKLQNAEKVKKKAQKKKEKKSGKNVEKKRLFVLNFIGDIKASAVEALREEITAILTVVRPEDQVLVRLESSGGMVHCYGLAASQLQRIKQKSIHLIVSVDKVAASGGYMMACVADQIIAAPFAVIGSIGVVAQIPNFNRFLKEHNVDVEQITAGKYKRTLTMFGENTEADRKKLKEELEETHVLFQDFILSSRKNLDMERVSIGEHWYGSTALEMNLIDKLRTGDDLLLSMSQEFDIFEVSYSIKKSFWEKISGLISLKAKEFMTIKASKSLF